jgi:anti-anti-sigma factor
MESLTTMVHGYVGRRAAFVHDSREGVESLHVVGDIDLANAAEFEAAIVRMSEFSEPIVIDLTCCTYMDSCALRVLLETSKRLNFGVVAAASSAAQRVFDIMNASGSLSIEYRPPPEH